MLVIETSPIYFQLVISHIRTVGAHEADKLPWDSLVARAGQQSMFKRFWGPTEATPWVIFW